ncbi:MAG TPA: cupin domain-containing protein [Sphingomonas sp.]|uniref:cupin domain-containing protein n=1 Tax=Sphingomonas sp. TaxID=28214 RepID=UPI002B9E2078|nr:cupin domain-containing protein [Sphingomonas sp.]HMI19814.1 cupin domain-containing protein [Sphingomonas sp.]
MKSTFLAGLAAGLLAVSGAQAQPSGLTRTDLQRHDLSIPGREAIQVRVDFAPGAVAGAHTHYGEEIIYVLGGTLEYQLADQPPVTLKAGGVLFVPTGVVHRARNVGTGPASELATYVVEKGKPLVTLAR